MKIKSIYTKFVIVMTLILILSSTIAFTLVSAFTLNLLYSPLVDMMTKKADELALLMRETDLEPEKLALLAENSFMKVNFYNDSEALLSENPTLSRQAVKDIESQKITSFVPIKFLHQRTSLYLVTLIEDRYVLIKPVVNSEIFLYVGKALRSVLAISVVITILFVLIVLKQIVKPLKRLTIATKQVAAGDFDIQVKKSSEDELGMLIMNFNKMTQELKNMEYLRKDFVSSVSHEFKTPIASISGFAKMLKLDSIDENARREYTDIIIDESERLSKLSSNLLRLSSLENQCIIDKVHDFSLDEQIRKVLLLLESRWSAKALTLDLDLDAIDFRGDEELLQQVWINLFDNAIKFSKEDGTLRAKATIEGKYVAIEISDSGSGMNEETQNRVFEKFFQGDRVHNTDGNGLGLSIVKRIIDLYDGIIELKSEPGVGTTFVVKLPIVGR